MDILAFFGGVWAAIIFGLFCIAMVIGCTFDRSGSENPKWWIFGIGIITLIAWKWPEISLSLEGVRTAWDSIPWGTIGAYLAIGVVYSVLEFALEVRRSARRWAEKWEHYKKVYGPAAIKAAQEKYISTMRVEKERRERAARKEKGSSIVNTLIGGNDDSSDDGVPAGEPIEQLHSNEVMVDDFMVRYGNDHSASQLQHYIIKVQPSKDKMGIEPVVDRVQLTESVGCWTIWWPFYLVSLIVGDLLSEIFRTIANVIASLSGRLVKVAFKDVFKMS